MAEMEAREGQRLRHQPLPEIGKRPALGLAEAHDMAELADRSRSCGRGCWRRSSSTILSTPLPSVKVITASTKSSSSRLMTFAAPILERAPLLAFRAHRADDGRAGLHGELRREQADAAADRVDAG